MYWRSPALSLTVSRVYAKNLEERIKIDQLKESLEEIFGEYGTILEIVAKRSLKRKGQAFIVFDNAESAATAIEEVQGFELFDKPMSLAFARTKSDATVKQEGSAEDFEQHKRKRLAEKGTSYWGKIRNDLS
jgi:RNA recognition motif-containing protein